MLTLGVLLLVSYSNALANKHREKKLIISLDQPDTVYIRYRQPINGYSISGNAIASTDTVFQNCYNLTLTFRNIKTDCEFSVNAGLLPRDYFVESVFVILCLYIRSSWLVSASISLASNLEYRHNSMLNPVGPSIHPVPPPLTTK